MLDCEHSQRLHLVNFFWHLADIVSAEIEDFELGKAENLLIKISNFIQELRAKRNSQPLESNRIDYLVD